MISIIIPVYNTGEYLHKCLSSVLNQTYKDFEVICVNDGSKDNSLEILNEYRKKDDRIIVINQENGGVSKARNTGLKYARGEYITFVDSDDWVHHQYLEALIKGINFVDVNMSIIRYKEIYDYEEEIVENDIDVSSYITLYTIDKVMNEYKYKSRCWGKLYKASIICEGVVLFPEKIKLGEDNDFVYNYLSRIVDQPVISVIKSDLYYYYHAREDSAIHVLDEKDTFALIDHFIESLDYVNVWLRRNYTVEGAKKLLRLRYVALLTSKKDIVDECNKRLKQVLKKISSTELGIATYCLYSTFYLLPWTYRLFMLINDPSMIKVEKKLSQ